MSNKFKCTRCKFKLNSHYIACLNLFSRLNDGWVAIRGGRIYLSLEAGSAVPVDVAPDVSPKTRDTYYASCVWEYRCIHKRLIFDFILLISLTTLIRYAYFPP